VLRNQGGWEHNIPGSDASEAVDGVRAIRSLDIGSNLLANGRIGSVVDEVEVEGLSVGAVAD
jgi:hypothetical protein